MGSLELCAMKIIPPGAECQSAARRLAPILTDKTPLNFWFIRNFSLAEGAPDLDEMIASGMVVSYLSLDSFWVRADGLRELAPYLSGDWSDLVGTDSVIEGDVLLEDIQGKDFVQLSCIDSSHWIMIASKSIFSVNLVENFPYEFSKISFSVDDRGQWGL